MAQICDFLRGVRLKNCKIQKNRIILLLFIFKNRTKYEKNMHCLAVRTEIRTGNFFIVPIHRTLRGDLYWRAAPKIKNFDFFAKIKI